MQKRIAIVSATTMNRAEFKGQAPLHKTLNKLRGKSSLFYQKIIYNNKSGLGEIYNRHLGNKKYFNDILLFVHDDVLIEDIFLSEKLNEAIRRFDVVGIAGGRTPRIDALRWLDPWENLCGAVGHYKKEEDIVNVNSYGPSPSECRLIDGLFIAVNVAKVVKSGVSFDDQFKFHFYDLDFCLSCIKNGLRIGTWPIWVVHYGKGDSPGWEEESARFGQKWQGQWLIWLADSWVKRFPSA